MSAQIVASIPKRMAESEKVAVGGLTGDLELLGDLHGGGGGCEEEGGEHPISSGAWREKQLGFLHRLTD